MSECEQIGASLSAWCDHELDSAGAAQVHGHLERCPACSAQVSRMQRLDSALKGALQQRSSAADFRAIWTGVERRIDQGVPWHERLRDRFDFNFALPRPAWIVSVAALLLLGVVSLVAYFPGRTTKNNFAFVESIDAHGANIALFREAETRTTVIWLFEDFENQDELSEKSTTANPDF